MKECLDDIGLLEEVLGESFEDWRSSTGRGSFKERAGAVWAAVRSGTLLNVA